MPIFEFRCDACEHDMETIVLKGESPPEACAECGGQLRRRWSRVATKFVGWGFSRNDSLLGDGRPRKPFKQIADKASELFD